MAKSRQAFELMQSWSFDSTMKEFIRHALILRIETVNGLRELWLAFEFTSKWLDLYDESGVIVVLSEAAFMRDAKKLRAAGCSCPSWIADLYADFEVGLGITVVRAESIKEGLRSALDRLGNLERTIRIGDLDKVKSLLTENPSLLNTPFDNEGDTPLIYAAWQGKPAIAKYLIELGAELNAQGDGGKTAVQYAVLEDSPKVLKLLLESGADPNLRDAEGRTALYWASMKSDRTATNLLLKHGADLDTVSAIFVKGADFVLKQVRKDPQELAEVVSSPDLLFNAIVQGAIPLVQLLLESGADPNASAMGHPMLLSALSHIAIFELLLRYGADPNTKESNTETPLLVFTKKYGFKEHHKLLLQYGATVDLVASVHIAGPESVIRRIRDDPQLLTGGVGNRVMVEAIKVHSVELVEALLKSGVDPNDWGASGYSCLRQAVLSNPMGHGRTIPEQFELVRLLLEHGADANPKDHPLGLSLLAAAKGKSLWNSGGGEPATSLGAIDATRLRIVNLLEKHEAVAPDFTEKDRKIIEGLANKG